MNPVSTSTIPEPPPTTRRHSSAARWLLGILLGMFLDLGVFGALVWRYSGVGLFKLASLFRSGRVQLNVDQPTVVLQIQRVQRLETVSYTMYKIISGERSN